MSKEIESKKDLKVCLRTPKFGTLAFFLVMIIVIPVGLVQLDRMDLLQFYLPFVVMLASTLTTSGAPDNFTDLYPLFPTTVMGFLSANLINFVALMGILWLGISLALEKDNLEVGVTVTLIMILITFPVATQAIPFFIRQGDRFIRRVAPKLKFPGNWHKYFLGFVMIVMLMIVEVLTIGLFTEEF